MLAFFHCVAESVVAKGVVSLAKEIPFGNTLYEVAAEAWRRFRLRKAQDAMRADIQNLAQAAADEVKQAAIDAARAAYPKDREKAAELELYLTQIPAAVRQSLRRQDDPSGRTVPGGLRLDKFEDLLPYLPARMSKFRPGDGLPGRDGWKLVDLLGTGGFGEVWLAAHPHFTSLKRAVKFCLELNDRDRTLLHEGGIIDRVMQAGPVPNVVPLIDANLVGEAPWLMYEYVAGGDLVSLVAAWREMPPSERHKRAFTGLKQVVNAVAHFHKLGVVHRDLKPANVLVSGTSAPDSRSPVPELKVADFGIGGVSASHELALDLRMTSTGARLATVGRGAFTPIYASPQQKRGNSPDPRDDVFALGIIGFQLLVGDVTAERPGGKGWRRELQSQGVNPALLDLLESCWDDTATERPANAGEVLARLDRETPRPPTAPPFPPLDPLTRAPTITKPPAPPKSFPSASTGVDPKSTTNVEKLPKSGPDHPLSRYAGIALVVCGGLIALGFLIFLTYLFHNAFGVGESWAVKAPVEKTRSAAWSIVGSWYPPEGMEGGLIIGSYRFAADGSVSHTKPGLKVSINGRYRLTADTLEITWDGEPTTTYDIRTKDAVMLVLGERPSKTNPNPALAVTWKRADKSGSGK